MQTIFSHPGGNSEFEFVYRCSAHAVVKTSLYLFNMITCIVTAFICWIWDFMCVRVFCVVLLDLDSFASNHVLTSMPQSVHMLSRSPVTSPCKRGVCCERLSLLNGLVLVWTASSVLSWLCLRVTAAVIVFIETSAPHVREEEGGEEKAVGVCLHALVIGAYEWGRQQQWLHAWCGGKQQE